MSVEQRQQKQKSTTKPCRLHEISSSYEKQRAIVKPEGSVMAEKDTSPENEDQTRIMQPTRKIDEAFQEAGNEAQNSCLTNI